jgi:hypothetical protein
MKFQRLLLLIAISCSIPSYAENNTFHGKINSIPPQIKKMMLGHSWHQGCPIGFDQLAYLQLSYWGFDNKPHVGEIIVYQPIAQETLDIFKQLFEIKFPIERMQLPETLPKGLSNSTANNTSGFYCRADEQNPSKMSRHSYGLAIDINDLYNPAVEGKKVDPEQGRKYLDRNLNHPGMIKEGDKVFEIFTSHGWFWGGFFNEVDYQHFDKLISKHYRINHMEYIPSDKQIKSLGEF